MVVKRHINSPGVLWVHEHIGHPRGLVGEQYTLKVFASVCRLVKPSLSVGRKRIAVRPNVNGIWIARIDQYAVYRFGGFKA